MSVEEQVDADFARAHRKAVFRRLATRLRRAASGRLPCFEEVRRKLGAVGGFRIGRRTVRLADVLGSVGRCSEFDGAFLPASGRARARWERIDRAFRRGEELPPVSLCKIGDSYFVHDGNHRVSVARFHGVEWIDAEVTEFRVPLQVNQGHKSTGESRTASLESRGRVMREMMDLRFWKQRREERGRSTETAGPGR